MTRPFNNSEDQKKLALLRVAERSLNSLGRKLYGSNWASTTCGMPSWALDMVDAPDTLKEPIECGDKSNNAPNCPIGL